MIHLETNCNLSCACEGGCREVIDWFFESYSILLSRNWLVNHLGLLIIPRFAPRTVTTRPPILPLATPFVV